MTLKHVKLSKNVHDKLLYLKQESDARTISDVIESLIITAEEIYLTGKLNVVDKQIVLKYSNGKLVEIKME